MLRRTGTLDAVLEPFLRKAPPDPVRHVLRLGAAGLLLLETPTHAAVATAVALARARGLAAFAGLVNAVLRRVGDAGAAALADLDGPRLDTPAWLWASWGETARAIAVAHQHEAPLDLTTATRRRRRLLARYCRPVRCGFPPGPGWPRSPASIGASFWVQDAAAALPARLLAARPGERVADLCAAPGGKTAQLAAAGASVVAVERDPTRLARLRENLRALATWRPTTVQADAASLDTRRSRSMRCCWTRHAVRPARSAAIPTCRISSGRATSGALAAVQDRLLAAAAAMLRPGGRLIYAVCSLQPEEGAPRIKAALARGGIRHDPFTPAELAGAAGGADAGRLLAHTPRPLAGAWRHGRVLCRAPDQDLSACLCSHRRACLDPRHVVIATRESRSRPACSPPISRRLGDEVRRSRRPARTGCISM